MVVNNNEIRKYLEDYKEGKIKEGLGIGLDDLDHYIRFKRGQFNIINGIDNVGKTIWMIWYFLCLSVKHNLRWCIWSGENKPGQLMRQLIQFYSGKYLHELQFNEIYSYEAQLSHYFQFINNTGFYTNKELYKMFTDSGCDGALIDPYTGLNREYTHSANYDFLNESREFCNSTGITLYVNTHVNSEASRREHPKGHEFAGYQMPPQRSNSEGGQPFANRVDDFITIHRYVGHPNLGTMTEIYIRKVKDTETGGQVSPLNEPVKFGFNKGRGFTCKGINPIQQTYIPEEPEKISVPLNTDFDNDTDGVPF